MAVNLVSPGINIREVDLTLGGITQTGSQIGAIAGPFEKGPINIPTLINNESELIDVFGKPKLQDDQNEYWYSASNFLSYGGKLRVVRVGNINSAVGALNNANSGVNSVSADLKIFNGEDYDNNHSNASSWYFAAKSPGSWSNNLKVCIIDNFADQIIGGINTTNIQVGYAITQYATTGSVGIIQGTSRNIYDGYLRGLITGIGNSEIYVSIQDFYDKRIIAGIITGTGVDNSVFVPATYTKQSAFAFNSTQNNKFYIMSGSGVVEAELISTGATVSDWYDAQTLGLTNSTIFWNSIAPKPGTSQYAIERGGINDEVHIVVVDEGGSIGGVSGNIIEKYSNLSKATDAKISPTKNVYYKNFISDISKNIFVGYAETGGSPSKLISSGITTITYQISSSSNWGHSAENTFFSVLGAKTYKLLGGSNYSGLLYDGFQPPSSDILNGYQLFTNPAEYSINYILAGPSGGVDELEAQQKANTIISISEQRKDCISTLSTYKDGILESTNPKLQTSNILRFFSPLTSSSYAVFDSGYKYTFDRFNNKFFYMACNSDVAGIMARTTLNNQPWFSPAGSVRGNINNVVKLAYNPNQNQRDELYNNRINPIISNSGAGFILFGDKTALSYVSAFDRINVRMLFLTIEKSIEQAARAQLFEFNDAITRSNFINIVEPYLRDVRAKRGITEFLIVCDETNNTPDIIDANQFKADIFVKPARSINFIGLTFVATRTGVSFSEVVGTV
jgi:hypothetical protein